MCLNSVFADGALSVHMASKGQDGGSHRSGGGIPTSDEPTIGSILHAEHDRGRDEPAGWPGWRACLRDLYVGTDRRAIRFQWIVASVDLVIIAFFILSPVIQELEGVPVARLRRGGLAGRRPRGAGHGGTASNALVAPTRSLGGPRRPGDAPRPALAGQPRLSPHPSPLDAFAEGPLLAPAPKPRYEEWEESGEP